MFCEFIQLTDPAQAQFDEASRRPREAGWETILFYKILFYYNPFLFLHP
jgi:hypothetical protein